MKAEIVLVPPASSFTIKKRPLKFLLGFWEFNAIFTRNVATSEFNYNKTDLGKNNLQLFIVKTSN